MILLKLKGKEYGLDMDTRCFSIGEVHRYTDKDGNPTMKLQDQTYHTEVTSLKKRLLMIAGARDFNTIQTVDELVELFKSVSSEIDEIFKSVPPLTIKREQ